MCSRNVALVSFCWPGVLYEQFRSTFAAVWSYFENTARWISFELLVNLALNNYVLYVQSNNSKQEWLYIQMYDFEYTARWLECGAKFSDWSYFDLTACWFLTEMTCLMRIFWLLNHFFVISAADAGIFNKYLKRWALASMWSFSVHSN